MALVKRFQAEWVVFDPLFVAETQMGYSSEWFRTFPEAEAELEMVEGGVTHFQTGKITARYFSSNSDPANPVEEAGLDNNVEP